MSVPMSRDFIFTVTEIKSTKSFDQLVLQLDVTERLSPPFRKKWSNHHTGVSVTLTVSTRNRKLTFFFSFIGPRVEVNLRWVVYEISLARISTTIDLSINLFIGTDLQTFKPIHVLLVISIIVIGVHNPRMTHGSCEIYVIEKITLENFVRILPCNTSDLFKDLRCVCLL